MTSPCNNAHPLCAVAIPARRGNCHWRATRGECCGSAEVVVLAASRICSRRHSATRAFCQKQPTHIPRREMHCGAHCLRGAQPFLHGASTYDYASQCVLTAMSVRLSGPCICTSRLHAQQVTASASQQCVCTSQQGETSQLRQAGDVCRQCGRSTTWCMCDRFQDQGPR